MKSNVFHNSKVLEKNLEDKTFMSQKNIIQKSNITVDINKILNRVKVENKINKRENFKFYIAALIFLSISVIFIFH